ncbi:MAG TPA: STAS domain-containing protein [bacterium]|nr:STAS domain-containing protein [bacterium]HPN30647.1 STAS domain-containing protein [bacterium]
MKPLTNYKEYSVFKLPEKFDSEIVSELKQEIIRMIEKGKLDFIIDFTETRIINSPGLGLLISIFKTLKEKNGKLKFFGVHKNLISIFTITKLNSVFEIFDSIEEID